jgi:hypothetical protein
LWCAALNACSLRCLILDLTTRFAIIQVELGMLNLEKKRRLYQSGVAFAARESMFKQLDTPLPAVKVKLNLPSPLLRFCLIGAWLLLFCVVGLSAHVRSGRAHRRWPWHHASTLSSSCSIVFELELNSACAIGVVGAVPVPRLLRPHPRRRVRSPHQRGQCSPFGVVGCASIICLRACAFVVSQCADQAMLNPASSASFRLTSGFKTEVGLTTNS